MPVDPFFRMTVKDVFFIRGRGTVVTGQIEAGTLIVGDEIYLKRPDSGRTTVVTGIEMFRKMVPQAQAGDNVGVLLRDVGKQDVKPGDFLLGSGTGLD
jgi:elongation factor Tu